MTFTNTAGYRTFELADPRDGAPRLVGYCKADNHLPLEPFWEAKHESESRWSEWMRELEAAGLEPVERVEWGLGKLKALPLAFVSQCIRVRAQQLGPANGIVRVEKLGCSACICVDPEGRMLFDD